MERGKESTGIENSSLEAGIRYFRSKAGFERVFSEMEKKLKSLGHPGGRISLKNAKDEERTDVGRFLGRSFRDKDISFSVKEFEEALRSSRFADVDITELIEGYLGRRIVSNRELRRAKEAADAAFYENLVKTQGLGDAARSWLLSMSVQECGRLFAEWKDTEKCAEIIRRLDEGQRIAAARRVQGGHIRLAVLAAQISGMPHYLDRNKSEGKLFLRLLAHVKRSLACAEADAVKMKTEEETAAPGSERGQTAEYEAERILKLYLDSGIRPDDISSHVTLYGIGLWENGAPVAAYEDFIRRRENYVVTLSNLAGIEAVRPVRDKVFIVENQMVFSELCERCPAGSFVCTSGQLRTAALLLIDLLCSSDIEIYYSGDLDPEGTGIADRVLERGADRITPFFMDRKTYLKYLSDRPMDPRDRLDQRRLSQLSGIRSDTLRALAEEMKKYRTPLYQESFLEEMIKAIDHLY